MGRRKKSEFSYYERSSSSQSRSIVLQGSQDGRRVVPELQTIVPTRSLLQPATPAPRLPRAPSSSRPDDREGYTFDEPWDQDDGLDEDQGGLLGIDDVGEIVQITAADVALGHARRYANSDYPLVTWIPYRGQYLDEVVRMEGRGPWAAVDKCPGCNAPESPTVRCRDCVGRGLVCAHCAVRAHAANPLHVLERWTGAFFERVPLAKLGPGLDVQLMHSPGSVCGHRQRAREDFTVLHTNGVHLVNLYFCGCGLSSGIERRQQLLRMGWWPATPVDPQSAATFQCMDTFHLLSLQGKVTGYDFYKSLELLTDASGLSKVPDRAASFMMMARQWRHITMMKRAGRGHDPLGIDGTSPGECAVACPACPLPGVNIPDDWEVAPKNRSWLYRLILAMDANFRLKNRLRSSRAKDPGLNTGMAYFVGDDEYNRHVEMFKEQNEISGCSRFAAVAAANLKSSKGLRVTGVGGIFCARHDFWRGNGLGDLQKGERYCNMDYIFLSSLVNVANKSLLVSYDIACQWSKNLLSRARCLPSFRLPAILDFVVPKFHLPAHKESCHAPYGLHYKEGAGQTDGESPERSWADMNGAAASTKEMGPGSRHDTLDDHCGHANWRKFVGLIPLLRRRLSVALTEAADQCDVYTDFTEALSTDHPVELQEWKDEIQQWEDDPTGMENPYHKPELEEPESTVAEVRLELAEKDGAAVMAATTPPPPAVSAFLLLGLKIETMQLKLRLDGQGERTAHQAALIQESRTAVLRLVRRLRADQDYHMPRLSSIMDSDESASGHETQRPEHIKLYLPSDFPTADRHEHCEPSMSAMEAKLRHAAMAQALNDLRYQLRFRTYMNKWKIKNIKGQRPNTRARSAQANIEGSVKRAAETYRLNYKAYKSLVGDGVWQDKFQELKNEDIRGLGRRLVEDIDNASEERSRDYVRSRNGGVASGESSYTLPWIWYSAGTGEGLELGDDLKLEWFKSRARAKRWTEEVIFLSEEMRRVVAYCGWKSMWWTARGEMRDVEALPELQEGIRAYAAKQASILDRFAVQASMQWEELREAGEVFVEAHDDDGTRLAPEAVPMEVD
ncbi:hypothetical protein BV25DRAFT_1920621 [Artomyces pyxidatus]|uniref:Uncharacterized protein n=1 Tax=Artomyces pyxidatus TaxID=48021 RepID=A0ACB8SKA3_9AGAM|nr:hypothetical protein BV25DRAFT_1920621 [Artomyces pyxidatus]